MPMDEDIEKYKDSIRTMIFDKIDASSYKQDVQKAYEIADAIIAKELESIQNGDYDKAKDCVSLYNEIYSKFDTEKGSWEVDDEKRLREYINGKIEEAHKEIMTQKFQEYENLPQDISSDELKNVLSEFVKFCEVWNIDNTADIRNEAIQKLQKVVDERIAKLEAELQEAKEHIELPKNETRCEELQTEIEELEDEMAKVASYAKGKELSFTEQQEIEEMKKHKIARIDEQGIDVSQIMAEIEGTTNISPRGIEGHIAKKTEYLERKLAYLQQYKDIPGNEKRIAEIEQQIESIQDRWKAKNLDLQTINQVRRNNERISDKKAKLADIEGALKRPEQYSEARISELKSSKEYIEQLISRIEQENELLLAGEHHKNRLERAAKAREERQAQAEKSSEIALEEQRGEAEQTSEQKLEQPSELKIEQAIKENREQEIQPSETFQEIDKWQDNTLETRTQQQLDIEPQERIMSQEESIKDEVGNDMAEETRQGGKEENANITLWMNRFEKYYSTISRLPQKIKAKFVQMKSDIVNAIKGALTERGKEQENTQIQDTNER